MNKTKNKSEDKNSEIINFFEERLIATFEERKYLFLDFIQKRLKAVINAEHERTSAGSNNNNWVEIESLSKLRALVGGRFENLKNRWLGAGLPLKQDKSTSNNGYKLDKEGWIELSSWISNQGFEVRLCHDKNNVIFEIKQLN